MLVADEILLKAREVATMQRPSTRDWESVRDWIVDNKPLVDDEQEFILHKEDMITLRRGRECAGFDGAVERALASVDRFLVDRCHCKIVQVSALSGSMVCRFANFPW